MFQEFELGRGSDILVRELFKLKEDETFLITADTESDFRVVTASARAAMAVGARPMVVLTATPPASGKAGEATWPVGELTAVLKEADAWVDYNRMGIVYSTPYEISLRENKRLRHLCLPGMHADLMTRCIARTDLKLLGEFLERVTEMTETAKHIRITTPTGGDVGFNNSPKRN